LTISIRQARLPADEPAILSFIAGLQDYESVFEPDRRRDVDYVVEHWRELQHRCAERHGIFLLAEEDEKPVGWAFAHDVPGHLFVLEHERRHGNLAELYVVPQARGRGHGRGLIAGCEAWALERGHKLLTVGVLSANARAIRSYEGTGYLPYTLILRRYL
jgi:GNAT superfamily N-acetyltransferase